MRIKDREGGVQDERETVIRRVSEVENEPKDESKKSRT